MNRLVDAARPESEIVRVLEAAARSNDAAAKQQLRSVLVRWRENHARLLPTIQGSFLLRETLPLSEDLARLGAIGLQALDYAEAHKQAPEVWIRQQKELLGQMERPRAEVILAAVRPVRILVENTDVRSGNERVRNNGATVPN